jgi:hypothetical protein
MSSFKVLAATVLSASLLATGPALAMEIQKFDKMAIDDQAEYVGLLSQGAEQVLADEGRTDLSDKVGYLFRTNTSDSNTSIGMNDFMITLAKARLADAQRALKDPNAKRVQVEDAMAVMLKNLHGIDLPKRFFAVNSNFRPKYPPPK